MPNRFCPSCGAKLLPEANFCVECGERQPGAKAPRAAFSFPVQRYAPLLVVLAVVAIGGGAVVLGTLQPKTPAAVPPRSGPPATGDSGNLPEGHPPLAIPEQVKQAIRDLKQQADAAPEDMSAWKRLAEVQYRAGQIEPTYLPDAAASYNHILDREPDNLDVLRNLGNIAFDQDDHDKAADYYQRYLKQKPDDLSVQTDLGTMYLSAGKSDQAMQQFQSVLKTDPKFFQAQFNLAIAYRTVGQTDAAAAALEKARDLSPDDKTRTQVEQLLARLKGGPAPPEGAAAPAAVADQGTGAAPTGGGSFQGDAEAIFRENPILGPKVGRIDWPSPESAQVHVRDFPMDQMPEAMRSMFEDRMKGRIREKKQAHNITQTARFDLIDEATGKVMDTITE
jgi:cytochrome c-type biogenesis protein CcmH/NrfG